MLQVEVRPDLDVTSVTVEVAGRPPGLLAPVAAKHGHPVRWSGPVPPAEPGEVSRYKNRVHHGDPDATPVRGSDPDPQPGGQEVAFEPDAPPPPEWARDPLSYHVMSARFARPCERLP